MRAGGESSVFLFYQLPLDRSSAHAVSRIIQVGLEADFEFAIYWVGGTASLGKTCVNSSRQWPSALPQQASARSQRSLAHATDAKWQPLSCAHDHWPDLAQSAKHAVHRGQRTSTPTGT
jgi:hypothetical protein